MTIALVQQVAARTPNGGSTSKMVTLPSPPTAGSAFRLLASMLSGQSISSVTGGGVTWSRVGTVTDTSAGSTVEIWGGDNSSGAGGTTVTIVVGATYGGATDVNVSEWSGPDTAPVADPAAATNTGTSATASTQSVTPTAGKNVLLLAVGEESTNTLTDTPSGGFTALTRDAATTRAGFAYQVVASASGSYSTSWPVAVGYAAWATIVAGWDGAAAAGGYLPPDPAHQPRHQSVMAM